MNLTLSTCFVLVHDPEQALAFYRDALGLEVRNDVAREDFRWITVGAASQPGVAIVLTNYQCGSPADGDPAEVSAGDVVAQLEAERVAVEGQ